MSDLERRVVIPLRLRKAAASAPTLLKIDGVDLSKPIEHLAFPVGDPGSNDGRLWDNTEADLDALEADFSSRSEACPVLYNHDENGPAAGWITGWRRAAEGLYVTMQLTPKAAAARRDGEYLYISPHTYGTEDAAQRWHPSAVREVSLVHTPAQKLGQVQAANAQRGETMDELLAQLRSNLGLPDTTAAEEVITAAIAKTQPAAVEAAAPAAVVPPAAVVTPVAPAAAANAQTVDATRMAAVEAGLAALRDEPEWQRTFAEARTAGKIVPPELEKELRKAGMQAAKTVLAALPAGQTPGTGQAPTQRAAGSMLPQTAGDHLRGHLHAYDQTRIPAYEAAIAHQKAAAANGTPCDFKTALVAATRRAA